MLEIKWYKKALCLAILTGLLLFGLAGILVEIFALPLLDKVIK